MSLLPGPTASRRAWPALLAAALAPLPLLASERLVGDPCALQYKTPSYDRRIFVEAASGFAVPLGRTLPYVVTPRIVLIKPLDQAYRWNLSGSVAARFGDDVSEGTLGARLHRSIFSSADGIMPGLAFGLGATEQKAPACSGRRPACESPTYDQFCGKGSEVTWATRNPDFFDRSVPRTEVQLAVIGYRFEGARRLFGALSPGAEVQSLLR